MLVVLHWKFFYIAILLLSIIGLVLWDRSKKLVFYSNKKAAIKTIIGLITILLIGDIIGINWRIFSTNTLIVSGIYLGSENIPLEEIFFLFLLSYFSLICYQSIKNRAYV